MRAIEPDFSEKSTVKEIRRRFDADVKRFPKVDLLHKNTCFAAFGAVKAG